MGLFSTKKEQRTDSDVRIEALERKVRDLETDWAQTYEKFSKLHLRMLKRAKREEEKAENALGDTNGDKADSTPRVTNPLAERLLHPYKGFR